MLDKIQKRIRNITNQKFAINIWYGSPQNFGHLGNPQRFINILGNISKPDETSIESTTYVVNGSEYEIPFALGSDGHRLADAGDFNIEVDLAELLPGTNNIVINATSTQGKTISQKVVVNYTTGLKWTLPYSVNFAEVKNIQDVAQIIDGQWTLENGGARTAVPYYDRLLAFGDMDWENYEVLAEVTINDFIPPFAGPPSYDALHFGMNARWRGHHDDGNQPRRKWYPLGAAMEFFTDKSNLRNCRWRMFGVGLGEGAFYREQRKGQAIELGQRYYFKIAVKTHPDSSTLYQMKRWSIDSEEPLEWNLEGKVKRDYGKGSILLSAHNTDITIWKVNIQPL